MNSRTGPSIAILLGVVLLATATYQHQQVRSLRAELQALRSELSLLAISPKKQTPVSVALGNEPTVTPSVTEPPRQQTGGTEIVQEEVLRTRNGLWLAEGGTDELGMTSTKAVILSGLPITPTPKPRLPNIRNSQWPGYDRTPQTMAKGGTPNWDHGQATGAPNTLTAGDIPTAWAPRSPQSGEHWLQLGYDHSVELREINIQETYNPGAISRVTALMPDGSERTLWSGQTTPPPDGTRDQETSLPVPPGIHSQDIRVYVDTNRVNSWPEIDAVEIVGTSGQRQWATSATASSSYSENYGSE
jgi:hypothetical protein